MNIDKITSILGMEWEKIVGKGIARLTSELNAEKVKFEVMDNGVRIGIACGPDARKRAAELWANHVKPEIDQEE